MRYRTEIDGLRAVAVVPVVFFHAGFSLFSGGFVGVDVFFVISGYLITTMLLSDLDAGKFSVLDFYERRARRIMPALFVVLCFTAVVCWFNFLPSEFKTFGQGITASVLFVANVYLYKKNSDYFGLRSEDNPILHLWSLAVEEQYYLFFPPLLLIFWRFGRYKIVGFVAVVVVASLVFANYEVRRDPSAAFFLLPSRAWELLVGSVVAFISELSPDLNKRALRSNVLSLCGLAMITGAVWFFDRLTPFPSVWAVFPVLGAALVILFATDSTLVGRLLSSKGLVFLGLISFSLYLWHQPIFAFHRVLVGDRSGKLQLLLLCLVSLVISYFCWRFVEKPFRDRARVRRGVLISLVFLFGGAFVGFGVVGHINNGYPGRNPVFGRLASNFGLSLECNGNYLVSPHCSTSISPTVAFFGNSYAMHLVEGFRENYPAIGLVQLTQDSCAPHLGDKRTSPGKMKCSEFVELALKTLLENQSIEKVFISSPFRDILDDEMLEAFENMVGVLVAAGKKVVIVGPSPSTGVDFGKCFVRNWKEGRLRVCDFERMSIPTSHFEIVRRLDALGRRRNVKFLDLTNVICTNGICRASVGDTLIYRDSGHLSREGSRFVFERFAEELRS
jgi:peptidoglycan/LPS O-acetylase OafA/YrhL